MIVDIHKNMELDKKDKKILYELDKDSRQPLSKIAKKVNLSREAVLYRLKKYQTEGIIRDFLTVIDLAKLGFYHNKVYLKLHNIREEEEKEMIQYLCRNPFVSWVSNCDGKYSLIFAVKSRDIIELNRILQDINNKYWKFIMDQDTTSIVSAHHFYRDYLIGEKATTERIIQWGGREEKIKLDEINIQILEELSKNTRVNAAEIASKLNISSDAVLQRIRQLEKSGVLEHYMMWPNVNKIAGLYYKVLVSLHNLTEEREKQMISYCLQNPNIIYVVNTLGPWQFEMDIEVKSLQEFRSIVRDFLNTFSEIVSDYTSLNIYEEYKFRFFEKEILK
jgi:Lrp/AsnC family leucine-responsive transcriptional regulator